jgi:isopentenyldiphosphate isomerase
VLFPFYFRPGWSNAVAATGTHRNTTGAYLWTNACCSHPMWNEPVEDAAQRRLQEELGFKTPLQKIFSFTYQQRWKITL